MRKTNKLIKTIFIAIAAVLVLSVVSVLTLKDRKGANTNTANISGSASFAETEDSQPAPETVWITYVDEDGEVYLEKTNEFKAAEGEEQEEPDAPADPSKDGYTFSGWEKSVDDNGNISYTAKWTEIVVETPTQGGAPAQQAPQPASTGVLGTTVFVGDSICSGFRVYGFTPANNCLAFGNVGVRSVFDYLYTVNGANYDLITALTMVNPTQVVFSMGMNDINMSTPEQFCANYDNLIARVRAALPNAKLFVLSITPTYPLTDYVKSFANSKITIYNNAISAHLAGTSGATFINLDPYLKSGDNLVYEYQSGDGIHLSPAAYQIVLNVVVSTFNAMGIN